MSKDRENRPRVPALLAVMWLQCAMWTCIALIYPSVTVPVFLGVLTVGAMFWDWKASRHD